ncbi:MAG: hypothetical protein IJK96_03720 [Bacteroidales bacterium]|nr:hypothetical protein [Bacteroidales bacterium]
MTGKFLNRFVTVLSAILLATPALHSQIILTSDQQLRDLLDPDKVIDLSVGYTPEHKSLRQVCETCRKNGTKTLTVIMDEFFRQYRPQAGTERTLTPDMDEYVDIIKSVSDFAGKYGMGLCLSLLSPLELGPAFRNYTGGESGRWLSYEVGYRNPVTGRFSLDIWEHTLWTNNKGNIRLHRKGVKAYAFRQKPLGDTRFIAVNPEDIIEIDDITVTEGDLVEGDGGVHAGVPEDKMKFPLRRLNVSSEGGQKGLEGMDRVFVMVEYETPEMDYFSPRAVEFLHFLMDKYRSKGINVTELYSDEMHIQQDWRYENHQENGQLNFRYLTKSFSEKYEERYDQPLDDRYLLYFACGAPYFLNSVFSVRHVQYVMGETPEDIHRTYLLRDRYYKMLNGEVVDLFKEGKEYATKVLPSIRVGGAYHASWAESPTIDFWEVERLHSNAYKYEYTSNFIWGNTVHQAAAACYDYFKWGEYLEPTGNDFAECGWADRNYYGSAMGASIGVINRFPNAYAAVWGLPSEANKWRETINEAYGASPGPRMSLLTDRVHRDIEVLMIYPMNLVAVDERFGSWMTQYGYANYLTSEKLVELGSVGDDGMMHVAAKEYGTIAVMFEPLPCRGLLDLLDEFASKGGKVLWFSAPPLIDGEGKNCSARWSNLFGADYAYSQYMGEIATGKVVEFNLEGISPQTILTDFIVDRIYPVTPIGGAETVARVEKQVVGTHRKYGLGDVYYFGFRPRDDQAASLGYETRTLFEILNSIGSYPPTGKFDVNDNPVVVSRTTDCFASKFPSGATAIVKHYRTHRENWHGGFSRNPERDAADLAVNPMPSDELDLKGLKVNGHEVSYTGKMTMAFNTDASGRLSAFNGQESSSVTVDGVEYTFADRPVSLAFGQVGGDPGKYRVFVDRDCRLSVPLPAGAKKVSVKNGKAAVNGASLSEGCLSLAVSPALARKWLDVNVSY